MNNKKDAITAYRPYGYAIGKNGRMGNAMPCSSFELSPCGQLFIKR